MLPAAGRRGGFEALHQAVAGTPMRGAGEGRSGGAGRHARRDAGASARGLGGPAPGPRRAALQRLTGTGAVRGTRLGGGARALAQFGGIRMPCAGRP